MSLFLDTITFLVVMWIAFRLLTTEEILKIKSVTKKLNKKSFVVENQSTLDTDKMIERINSL